MNAQLQQAVAESAANADFMAWLQGQGYVVSFDMGNGMWCGVRPLLFHYTLHIGVLGDQGGYDDRYCYADLDRALAGICDWAVRGFDGEPKFWRKHPKSNRCRNDDGDPASETVGWPRA